MGVSDSTRVIGAVLARGSVGSRPAAFVLVSLIVIAGLSLAMGPTAAAGASPPLVGNQTPSVSRDADGAVGIAGIPEYLLSPLTGDSYRIFKDADHGTYLYCASDGRCFVSPRDIMALEARGLPPWALVVEPALRSQVTAAGPGSSEEVRVIIELRDGTFSRVAAEAWARVDSEHRALEGRAAAFADLGLPDKATMDRIDALNDATRSRIYARAESELSPLIAEVNAAVSGSGGIVGGSTPVLPAVFARIPLASIPDFAMNPWVARISGDRPVPALMDVSAYAIRSDTWWTNGYTGGTWDGAVMDTGVDASHPAFAGVTVTSRVFHAAGQGDGFYADDPTDPDDLHSHGTHVAGTVASNDGTYRGVAYGLDELINVKAGWLTTFGGGAMYPTDGMSGVDWAVRTAGADVVSLSFGGGVNVGDTAWERFFDAVIDGLGVPVTIAAGNSGPGARTVGEPGAGFNILSVGAVNDGNTVSRGDDGIAGFSSRGPTGDGRLKPDISAPGVSITSAYAFWEANPDFIAFDGTSMATPHIAAAHVLLENGIGSTFPPRYKALLLNSAEDKGNAGADTAYGWGYVDLQRAFLDRNNVREGNVTDGAVHYVFYRGAAAAGDRATLVWNRHATYSAGTYPTVYSPLNDVDLLSYDEASGNRLAVSMRTVDNVEQVAAAGATSSMVYKVHVPGTLTGVTREHYAIALPPGTLPFAPPALTITASGPAMMEMGVPFTVTANVTDVGGLAAQAVSVTLNLPAGLTRVSGSNPQNVGRIPAGGLGNATWQVSGTTLGPKTVTAAAASTSYEEAFSATSAPFSVLIVDIADPVSSVDALPPDTTAPTFGVTVTASDVGGVARVELFYRHDGGTYVSAGTDNAAPWAWAFDTTATFGDGFYEFYSVATDVATNTEATPTDPDASTFVDTAPPISVMTALPTYETVPTFDLEATPSDPPGGSGLAQVDFYVTYEGGAWSLLGSVYGSPWTWTFDSGAAGGDGRYDFYSVAIDGIGNVEPKPQAPEVSTTVDTVAPVTTRALGGLPGRTPWYVSDVTVSLSPSDATTGVASTEYRIDGGSWVPYAGPFLLASDGVHTVEFFSTDSAGNVEGVRIVTVSMDTVAPATAASLGGSQGGNGWFSSVVAVTLLASDATSDIDTVEVQVDGGGWQLYSVAVPIGTEGDHEIGFRSVDKAGNAESDQVVRFRIDRTPPITGHTLSGTQGGGGWYTSSVTALLSGTDSLSGIAGIDYRIDGGGWTPYGGPFAVDLEGARSLEFRGTDVAGNVEAAHASEFKIDTLPPEVSISEPGAGAVLRGTSVTATWSRSDAGSGIDACTVGLDGGSPVPSDATESQTFADVADGPHVVAVTCTDVAGNHKAASVDFTVSSSTFTLDTYLWPFLLLALLVSAFVILFLVAGRRRRKEEEPPAAVPAVPTESLPPPPPAEPAPPAFLPPPPPPDDPPPPPPT